MHTAMSEAYVHLLEMVLTGLAYPMTERSVSPSFRREAQVRPWLDAEARLRGSDWPLVGATMVGLRRLQNVAEALGAVQRSSVAGAFVECGVWRGGSSAYAAAHLRLANSRREIFMLDSFRGFPLPKLRQDYEAGVWNIWESMDYLAVSQDQVRRNFGWLSLPMAHVRLVPGFFAESVPRLREEVGRIAVLRFDGDLYASTMDILYGLYDRLAVGGWLIVDDWNIWACRSAVEEFRAVHGIREPIEDIDGNGVYWVKERDVFVQRESWAARQESSQWHHLAPLINGAWRLGFAALCLALFLLLLRHERRKALALTQ